MPNTFCASDHHLFHPPINALCQRPFESNEHAAEEMVRRHNKVVRPEDTCFFLGDFWFGPRDDGRMREWVQRFNGTLVLVLGNHDRASVTATNGWMHQRTYLDAGFAAVVDASTLTLPQVKNRTPRVPGARATTPDSAPNPARKVVLSHFPYEADHTDEPRFRQFRLRDEGRWLLHGHVHGEYTVRQRGVNVGVDVWDFTPVNVHDLARLIADVEHGRTAEF